MDPSSFTHRHLSLLRSLSPRSPLRVIAHIDLDAFYAQCEMVRLHTPRSQPLAVQQWDSLIAVNYAARAFGITRMTTAADARAKCPELLAVHVATFREGEGGKWAYREQGDHDVRTDKVSLDPYRAQSRKIMAEIQGGLEEWAGEKTDKHDTEKGRELVRVEKAGIDEVFVDLSALVWAALVHRYPMLRATEEEGTPDLTAHLPRPPLNRLPWAAEDELVDLEEDQREDGGVDWDDVGMLIGAEIVASVRRRIYERLGYTCSAGIARNKLMAKLGSATHKPNRQTVVRNRAIQQFLSGFRFTQFRMLGGKLGQRVAGLWGTERVEDLLKVPLEQMRSKLDDETGVWLHGLIRGQDLSDVTPRTQLQSVCSTKAFRPGLNSFEQAEKWLRIFAADIYGRLVDEGVLEHRRRPTVLAVHHRYSGQSKSRQVPLSGNMALDGEALFGAGRSLLRQIVGEGHAWPCANLALTVSGFEEGVAGNMSLDGFFGKKRVLDPDNSAPPRDELAASKTPRVEPRDETADNEHKATAETAATTTAVTCPRCQLAVLNEQEHRDWHFAKDLQARDRRPLGRAGGKRQTRLAFG